MKPRFIRKLAIFSYLLYSQHPYFFICIQIGVFQKRTPLSTELLYKYIRIYSVATLACTTLLKHNECREASWCNTLNPLPIFKALFSMPTQMSVFQRITVWCKTCGLSGQYIPWSFKNVWWWGRFLSPEESQCGYLYKLGFTPASQITFNWKNKQNFNSSLLGKANSFTLTNICMYYIETRYWLIIY